MLFSPTKKVKVCHAFGIRPRRIESNQPTHRTQKDKNTRTHANNRQIEIEFAFCNSMFVAYKANIGQKGLEIGFQRV